MSTFLVGIPEEPTLSNSFFLSAFVVETSCWLRLVSLIALATSAIIPYSCPLCMLGYVPAAKGFPFVSIKFNKPLLLSVSKSLLPNVVGVP